MIIAKPLSISVLVLTYNEAANLPYLLDSLRGWVSRICIVDSGSTDETLTIAQAYGAEVAEHSWTTYADQFNWGLQHFALQTEWVMRMDADEYVLPALAEELRQVLPSLPTTVTGLYVKRRVYFWGRWIRHGGYYPTWLLRIFRTGVGHCENRWMDEHIVLSQGETQQLQHDIVDENHKDLRFWTLKHEGYAGREAMDATGMRPQHSGYQEIESRLLGGRQDEQKRWVKGNLYQRLPLFWRVGLYFVLRYVFLGGFLDGREGLIFHTLQGFWYRFYVDAKIAEMRRSAQAAQQPGR